MPDHAQNKRLIADFMAEVPETAIADLPATLAKYCRADVEWRIFHPFNDISGIPDAAARFWGPLKAAFPDHEQRMGFLVAGTYEGSEWVSTLGHVMGNFDAPWLGIQPTHQPAFLRLGLNARIRDGKIEKCYILIDIIDLMRQAGCYPLRRMPGTAEQWPLPPCATGAAIDGHDAALGAETLRITREMQMGLAQGKDLEDLGKTRGNHSPHWHKNMNWYGPAGIGSSRGQKGFLDYHGALFIQAFPDRRGIVREPEGDDDRDGHYIRAGDGHFSVTGGWPSLYGTHTGGNWLGLPPSGKFVEMRVADWYRTDEDDLLIDNWVMMDIPHMLDQFGLDIFEDVKFFADPTLNRWPL